MKKITTLLAAWLLILAIPAFASDVFPDVSLKGTISPEQRAYLGVGDGDFTVSDIKGDFLMVEVYSMYCPICQRQAPRVEETYRTLMAERGSDRVKTIGIAAGNTQFEVDFYRKKYGVEFPLFKDEDYTVHKAVGEVGTPAFYLIDMRDDARNILFFHEGAVEDSDAILETLLEKTK